MASTNKTTNYDLSQYIGTDKPTFLGDYNSDMLKIDTAMKDNADGILENNTIIGGLVGRVTNLEGTTSDNTNDISDINTNIGDLANLTTSIKTSIVSAINEIVGKFNLTEFETFDVNNMISSGLSNILGSITVATNQDGSVFKIYGSPYLIAQITAENANITFQTKIRPSENITLSGIMYRSFQKSDRTPFWDGVGDITITTTGIVNIPLSKNFNDTAYIFNYMPPCIYFAKNFGDVVNPNP